MYMSQRASTPSNHVKSVELHDKVIGHYLNIKHYQ
nr:IS1 family transposase [Escherichia coli]